MVSTQHNSGRNEKRSVEVTMVFYGVEAVVNIVLRFLNETNIKIDACVDQTRPLIIEIDVLKEAFTQLKIILIITKMQL